MLGLAIAAIMGTGTLLTFVEFPTTSALRMRIACPRIRWRAFDCEGAVIDYAEMGVQPYPTASTLYCPRATTLDELLDSATWLDPTMPTAQELKYDPISVPDWLGTAQPPVPLPNKHGLEWLVSRQTAWYVPIEEGFLGEFKSSNGGRFIAFQPARGGIALTLQVRSHEASGPFCPQ